MKRETLKEPLLSMAYCKSGLEGRVLVGELNKCFNSVCQFAGLEGRVLMGEYRKAEQTMFGMSLEVTDVERELVGVVMSQPRRFAMKRVIQNPENRQHDAGDLKGKRKLKVINLSQIHSPLIGAFL